MRELSIPQIEFISGQTPAESAALFNEAMMRLAAYHPTFERAGSDFYIFYEITKREAESDREERPKKAKATCGDCLYLSKDLNRFGEIDKRKKWATCSKTGIRTHITSKACGLYKEEEQ